MSDKSRRSMATAPKTPPKTKLEYFRDLADQVDTSVKGDPKERAEHQVEILKDWRPVREKAGK